MSSFPPFQFARRSGPISPTERTPESCMARTSSSRRISSARAAPASPAAQAPYSVARPSITPSAPSASAFTTSTPRRTPPSTSTLILPFTARTMGGSASSAATAPSSCRPPWLDTTTASTPIAASRAASSARRIPFTSIFLGQRSRISFRPSQLKSASQKRPTEEAISETLVASGAKLATFSRTGIDRKSTRLNSSHTVIYTLSLHDALPISVPIEVGVPEASDRGSDLRNVGRLGREARDVFQNRHRSEEHTSELQSHRDLHSFPTRRSSDLRPN